MLNKHKLTNDKKVKANLFHLQQIKPVKKPHVEEKKQTYDMIKETTTYDYTPQNYRK